MILASKIGIPSTENNTLLGIELMKPWKPDVSKATYCTQVVIQHLCSSFHNRSTGMLTLLTDLNDFWCFFWFGSDQYIIQCRTNITQARFLLKNMFNSDAENNFPEGFQSRLSWNDFFSVKQQNAARTVPGPGGNNEDQGDGNNCNNADAQSNFTNDGANRDDNPGVSKNDGCGLEKWNDGRDVGNEMDLLDFVDEDEEAEILLMAVIKANFPDEFLQRISTGSEEGDNNGNLRLSTLNLMRHNVLMNG